MTLQPNLTDPFELLDTDAKIVPILPKSRLDDMIARAATAKQIEAPRAKPSSLIYGRKGWWSGGLATAACLILLLTLFPMNQTVVKNVIQPAHMTAASSTPEKQIQDGAVEISDMMLYDTLEGY